MRGECLTQNQLADEAGRVYSTPWDSFKNRGCVCDLGFRGPDCSLIECPSGAGKSNSVILLLQILDSSIL